MNIVNIKQFLKVSKLYTGNQLDRDIFFNPIKLLVSDNNNYNWIQKGAFEAIIDAKTINNYTSRLHRDLIHTMDAIIYIYNIIRNYIEIDISLTRILVKREKLT